MVVFGLGSLAHLLVAAAWTKSTGPLIGILCFMEEREARKETPGKEDASFGSHLRNLRRAAGLTQEELALRAGLSPNAVGALERGARRRPYPHTVRVLSDALNLSENERAALVATVPGPGGGPAGREDAGGHLPVSPAVSTFPHAATQLVGREREVEEVGELLARPGVRLLTLTGIGGVGKTRLAAEVARATAEGFTDGAAFVGFASLSDHSLVVPTILRTLGLTEAEGRSPVEALIDQLGDRRLLLVLDNLEHLLEAAPELAGLVEGCPGLTVLVTSRAPLRVRGEVEYPVPPLALPSTTRSPSEEELLASPSGRLFVERARAASPGFAITRGNAASVAAICWRLAGLPLALELAAVKVRFLDPATLLARLDRALSTAWGRDLPERQRTMRATLDWSHDLLGEPERGLFRRLSVFAGGFTLEGMEAVGARTGPAGDALGAAEDVLELLGGLVEQSLVIADVGRPGQIRYRMLEPVRQYALQRLEESGEAGEVRRRHAGFYRGLAEEAEPELKGAGQVEWLDRLDREHDDLRAAVGWLLERDEAEAAARFGYSLYVFWWIRGYHTEGRLWAEAVLARAPDLSAAGRAKTLFVRGAMAMAGGDHPAAEKCYAESLASFEAAGDPLGGARPRLGLALLALSRSDAGRAGTYLKESAGAASEAGDHFWAALSLSALGMVALGRGDPEAARASLAEGLALSQRAGDRFSRYIALYNMSVLAQAEGDDGAVTLYKEGLVFSRDAGDRANVAYCMEGLASLAAKRGAADRAARLLGAAQRLREGAGAAVYTYRQDRSLREQTLAAVRQRLTEEGFERALARGRAMEAGRAVEYALEEEAAGSGTASPTL